MALRVGHSCFMPEVIARQLLIERRAVFADSPLLPLRYAFKASAR